MNPTISGYVSRDTPFFSFRAACLTQQLKRREKKWRKKSLLALNAAARNPTKMEYAILVREKFSVTFAANAATGSHNHHFAPFFDSLLGSEDLNHGQMEMSPAFPFFKPSFIKRIL